ncbi:DUF397 domain-containing protein [Streptomyces sp. CA-251387]|uniref:DUF397 domain-containing protein n=1 Tax=Streptomyces sp. CA-251387 TaxID=3240064 RepID=UPI003D8DAA0E
MQPSTRLRAEIGTGIPRHPRTAIRDSKDPARAHLSFPTGSFTAFIEALKDDGYSTVTDFARFRG